MRVIAPEAPVQLTRCRPAGSSTKPPAAGWPSISTSRSPAATTRYGPLARTSTSARRVARSPVQALVFAAELTDPEPIRAGDVVRLDEGADGGDASHPTVQVRQARLGPADLADQVGFVDRAVPDPPLDAVDQRPIAVGGRTEHVEGGPVEDRLARTRVPQHRRHHVELGSVRLAERAPDHVCRRDHEADGQSGQREGAAGTARSCWRGLENHREGEARVES